MQGSILVVIFILSLHRLRGILCIILPSCLEKFPRFYFNLLHNKSPNKCIHSNLSLIMRLRISDSLYTACIFKFLVIWCFNSLLGVWLWTCYYISVHLRKWLQVSLSLSHTHTHTEAHVCAQSRFRFSAIQPTNSQLLASLRIPESLPRLHDKVVAEAAEAALKFSLSQKSKQVALCDF